MNIRRATEADEPGLRGLWEQFEAEVPEPPGFQPEPWEEQWAAIRRSLDGGAVYVAQEGSELVGVVHLLAPDRGVAHLEWAHVQQGFRRRGLVKALLLECLRDVRDDGVVTVSLEALTTNEPARSVWQRLGFEVVELFMAAPAESLERRLAEATPAKDHL